MEGGLGVHQDSPGATVMVCDTLGNTINPILGSLGQPTYIPSSHAEIQIRFGQ